MPTPFQTNVSLTGPLKTFIDDLVKSGEYGSASEVVRDALRTLKQRRDLHAAELAEIQERIAASLDQADRGEFAAGTADEVFARSLDRAKRKSRAGS